MVPNLPSMSKAKKSSFCEMHLILLSDFTSTGETGNIHCCMISIQSQNKLAPPPGISKAM